MPQSQALAAETPCCVPVIKPLVVLSYSQLSRSPRNHPNCDGRREEHSGGYERAQTPACVLAGTPYVSSPPPVPCAIPALPSPALGLVPGVYMLPLSPAGWLTNNCAILDCGTLHVWGRGGGSQLRLLKDPLHFYSGMVSTSGESSLPSLDCSSCGVLESESPFPLLMQLQSHRSPCSMMAGWPFQGLKRKTRKVQ